MLINKRTLTQTRTAVYHFIHHITEILIVLLAHLPDSNSKISRGGTVVEYRRRGRMAPGLKRDTTLTPHHTAVSRAHVAPILFGIVELQKKNHTED
ncbi:hypothetical protein AVEN_78222-1 [Araneus ventricosus]|uniref:Uncharacterized protein n=1 Tax=Araneus ventricosus TaxID=182803 RepID=A0A4Y2LLJ1_ARAVE|nr:hypothetical protein AVEN_78222-1 [Araneus ventricosus]